MPVVIVFTRADGSRSWKYFKSDSNDDSRNNNKNINEIKQHAVSMAQKMAEERRWRNWDVLVSHTL